MEYQTLMNFIPEQRRSDVFNIFELYEILINSGKIPIKPEDKIDAELIGVVTQKPRYVSLEKPIDQPAWMNNSTFSSLLNALRSTIFAEFGKTTHIPLLPSLHTLLFDSIETQMWETYPMVTEKNQKLEVDLKRFFSHIHLLLWNSFGESLGINLRESLYAGVENTFEKK